MIELTKDKKAPVYIITRTDNEGFHRQLNVSHTELRELYDLTRLALESERA